MLERKPTPAERTSSLLGRLRNCQCSVLSGSYPAQSLPSVLSLPDQEPKFLCEKANGNIIINTEITVKHCGL